MSARSYRFGDASRPGVLLGLAGRQVVPLIAGVLVMTLTLQTSAPAIVALAGPALGAVVAFGRHRGLALNEVASPGLRLWWGRRQGRAQWVRTPLTATSDLVNGAVPAQLAGLELLEIPTTSGAGSTGIGVIHDRTGGTVTAVVRARVDGFALASPTDQDSMLAGWGAALAPFARERSPIARIVWQEWAHPVGVDAHRRFLAEHDLDARAAEPVVADYLSHLGAQARHTVVHETLLCVSVAVDRVRRRRATPALDAALEVLADEVALFSGRLAGAGVVVDPPLGAAELAAAVRTRSDPTRHAAVTTMASSLAAAAGRATLEWGPMATEPAWSQVRVDGSFHRSFRVASWPLLPVGADWLEPLLASSEVTRTITVVAEPVPPSRAARQADREVMSREADAEMKERRGFRVSERDRKRIDDVRRRETELTQGHPEFRFVGLVDVCAPDLDALDDACAAIEQHAGQCLIDLRALEARHHLGWVASLPLGRNVAPPKGLT